MLQQRSESVISLASFRAQRARSTSNAGTITTFVNTLYEMRVYFIAIVIDMM